MPDALPPVPVPPRSTSATCPRCGVGFHCGAHDAAPCACTSLTLTPTLQRHLRERYAGCLCLACLRELAGAQAAG